MLRRKLPGKRKNKQKTLYSRKKKNDDVKSGKKHTSPARDEKISAKKSKRFLRKKIKIRYRDTPDGVDMKKLANPQKTEENQGVHENFFQKSRKKV